MKEENAALCRALSSLTGVSVSPIYPDSPEQFYDEACAARFCRECPYQQKNEFNTHLYGLSEAYRWDGHFIYYCPKAMVFVAAAILDGSGSLGGGMIAGPIVMGDIQDITCYTDPAGCAAWTAYPAGRTQRPQWASGPSWPPPDGGIRRCASSSACWCGSPPF